MKKKQAGGGRQFKGRKSLSYGPHSETQDFYGSLHGKEAHKKRKKAQELWKKSLDGRVLDHTQLKERKLQATVQSSASRRHKHMPFLLFSGNL